MSRLRRPPSSNDVKAAVSLAVIRTARRLVLGTPVQRWRLTEKVHRRVVDQAWGRRDVVVSFRGVQLRLPTKDLTIVPGIIGGFYEQHELDLFERLAAASSRIVDVGGNIGVYATIGAKRLLPGGQLIAFEPVPENSDLLAENLASNGLADRVVLVRAAVGDGEGELPLYLAPLSIGTHSASSLNASGPHGKAQQILVPVTTLDTDTNTAPRLNEARVDLLKVDVEGYDGHVLRGAQQLLQRDAPTLLVEYVPSHLEGCGFSKAEFLERIFDCYDAVWAVTGATGRIAKATLEGVLGGPNANLVAVSDPVHRRIVEDWATKR